MDRKTFIIIASISLSLLFAIFILSPQYKKLKDIESKIKEKDIELQTQKEYFSNLRSIFSELDNYKEQIAKIDSAIPQDPSLPSLYNFLQNKISENGLILKKTKLESTGEKSEEKKNASWDIGSSKVSPSAKELKEISIKIFVSGSYSSFNDFLLSIENTSRLINVKDINITVPKEEQSLDFELDISFYSY
ncbi:MAG TPA: hypothetical protein ENH06_00985 [bacterium]|nr:hypothetical protein [bacterium]